MKYLIIILIILFFSCDKEPEYTPIGKIYPLEGNYKGELTIVCDSVWLNKAYPTNIWITSNGEEILIRHTQCTGNAYPSANTFHYGTMQWIDLNDCGDPITFDFEGTGILEGDSLKEDGSFLLYTKYRTKPYYGNWKTRSIKIN
jgi:hypothetical protein